MLLLAKQTKHEVIFNFGVIFQKIGQNGRPGRREPPQSISFDETNRIKAVWGRGLKIIFCHFLWYSGRSKVQLSTKKVQLFACATAHKGKIGRSYMLKKRRGALRAPRLFCGYLTF